MIGVLALQTAAGATPAGASVNESCGSDRHPRHGDAEIDWKAPVIARSRLLIKAPVKTIWRIQTDIDNWATWQPELTSASLVTPGKLRKGSVFHWVIEHLEITSTVRQVRPLRRLVWGGPANGITGVHVWTFTPTKKGVLVCTEESWAGKPVDADIPGAQKLLRQSLVTWLQHLKEASEARAAQ
ncbi:SRPBCC family protein [Nonomuraea lactucae]|uniref:SRPBCC family protein n=1 Tax=Nonomuraea lactucae TaxID=2249762 RepID=UPI0013B3910F|nr:SRPBCC family protein [Nonomuraea lactucae]